MKESTPGGSFPAGSRVRQNYWAILVAAVVSFLIEAIWYSLFLDTWLDGTGRTREGLMAVGMSPAWQYLTALVAAAVMATAISCITQLLGKQTALHGMRVGLMCWLGFVLTTWSTEYVFEVRPVSLLAVNGGFWLIGMVAMGAIVGGWKKKAS